MATNAEADARTARGSRFNFRTSARQEQLLRAAAAATHRTLTDFVVDTAVVEAERVLADRRFFTMSDAQWDALDRLLGAPPRETPRLAALLAEPSPFGSDRP